MNPGLESQDSQIPLASLPDTFSHLFQVSLEKEGYKHINRVGNAPGAFHLSPSDPLAPQERAQKALLLSASPTLQKCVRERGEIPISPFAEINLLDPSSPGTTCLTYSISHAYPLIFHPAHTAPPESAASLSPQSQTAPIPHQHYPPSQSHFL